MASSVAGIILDDANEIFVSIASLWEMAIKSSLGKLSLHGSIEAFQARAESIDIATVPISAQALDIVRTLPFHHNDPFDRVIVATAYAEGLILLTSDTALAAYPVQRHWAD